MDRLKGKDILIGKEPGNERLLIYMLVDGKPKTGALGQPHSVPSCVSRCVPQEGKAHCKVSVDMNGNLILTNLKPENVTYVDGMMIQAKVVSEKSQVQLGMHRFPVKMESILTLAKKLCGEPIMSIAHLEGVWNTYKEEQFKMKKSTQKNGMWRSIAPIFTMGSGGLIAVSRIMNMPDWITILTCGMTLIGVAIMVYAFINSAKDKSLEKSEQLQDWFQSNYVCPNPQCKHFMGNQSYKILKQTKSCPYCRTKFKTEP